MQLASDQELVSNLINLNPIWFVQKVVAIWPACGGVKFGRDIVDTVFHT